MQINIKHSPLILLSGVLLMLLCLCIANPALAASTYTTGACQTVSPAQLYPTDNPDKVFNQIMVEIPGKVIPGTYYLNMTLPSDFYTVAEAVYAEVPSGDVNQLEGVPEATGVGSPKSGTDAYNEWNFIVTFGDSGTRSRFYVELSNFYVASGATGDVNAAFKASPGSPFSSDDSVKIATADSGGVTVSIDQVNSINMSSGKIGTLRIMESNAGALESGSNSVNLKLPNGFTWSKPASGGVLVWGDAEVVPAAADFAVDQNGSRLKIARPKSSGSSSATYYSISGLEVNIDDDNYAAKGEVNVSVGGDSTVTPNKLLIGKYGDYSGQIAVPEASSVKAGRLGEEIGNFVIEETAPGVLSEGRTITLKTGSGVKWSRSGSGTGDDPYVPSDPPVIDTDSSDLQGIEFSDWVFNGSDFDTIKTSVTRASSGANKGATIVFKEACIDLKADMEGDIDVTLGGSAELSGKLTVAKAIIPVTAAIEGNPPSIIIGKKDQPIADIIIAEAKANCIPDTGSITIDGTTYAKREIWLEFPKGVIPAQPEKVEVIEGDMVIDKYYLQDDVGQAGLWYMVVETLYRSYNPSKIKISGMKISVDRSIPEGPVELELKGPGLLQSVNIFTEDRYMCKVAVANNVSAAPDSGNVSEFRIGDTKYTVNGDEQTLDVVPFIENGRTYLPLRYAAYGLGITDADIYWDPATSAATFIKGGKAVQVSNGSDKLIINGSPVTMDVPAQIKDGHFVVPIRFIGQAFGAAVEWDGESQTVTMSL
jgi:hypothetical protein